LELVSPPLPLPEFVNIVSNIFDFISDYGHTDSQCGFHVGISIENTDLNKDLDIVKLLLFHDEELVYKHFDERKGNKYAQSVKSKLSNPQYEFDDLHKIIKIGKLEKEFTAGKFYGINLDKIAANYLEFRYMGGNDYEDKWDDIKTLIGNHAYNLKLATDKNFKRKEYVKRLSRYIYKNTENNISKFVDITLCMYMVEIMRENFGNDRESNQIIKNYWTQRIDNTCKKISNDFQPKSALRNFKLMDIDDNKLSTILSAIVKRVKNDIEETSIDIDADSSVAKWILNELSKIENMSPSKFKLQVYRTLK